MYTLCSPFAICSYLSEVIPSGPEVRRLAAVGGQRMGRVARIAAAILAADIGDGCVGALGLDPQRRDQRIFRDYGDAVSLALGHEAHSVMTRHVLNLPPQA